MLTLFSTPKAFRGHSEVIQRNALKSWKALGSDCEVVLFGDDPGTAEICAELGIRHEPEVRRSEFGTKRLDYMFSRVQEISKHELFCYVNCDIVLLNSFREALERVSAWHHPFLMVGQRWNTPVTSLIDFENSGWDAQLREFAMSEGQAEQPYAVDYFAFTRGQYRDMPAFVVGRVCWDHWIVWRARMGGVPVVDATADVLAVHQNHDFGYHPAGLDGVRRDFESRRNRKLAGGQLHLYTIEHATHQLSNGEIEPKPGSWSAPVRGLVDHYTSQSWYWFLNATKRPRHVLGVRAPAVDKLRARLGLRRTASTPRA